MVRSTLYVIGLVSAFHPTHYAISLISPNLLNPSFFLNKKEAKKSRMKYVRPFRPSSSIQQSYNCKLNFGIVFGHVGGD